MVFQLLGSRGLPALPGPGRFLFVSPSTGPLSVHLLPDTQTPKDADPRVWVSGEVAVEYRALGGIPLGAGNIGVFELPLPLTKYFTSFLPHPLWI